jgi:DnaJ-like protein/PilZ domain-containing protein
MSGADYYRILHVQPDAPAAIIHASYRTLVQRAMGASQGESDIAQLDAAYAVLGDPQRRAAYDVDRAAHTDAAPQDGADAGGAAGTRSCLFCGALHALERVLERDDECGRCGSPLFPAERHRLEYSGQRMLRRIPKVHAINVWVTWPQDAPLRAEMRNLSLNGMSFASNVRFEPNQIVRIDCTELRALGRIAHVEQDSRGTERFTAGVEFLTLRFRQIKGSFVSAKA